MFHYLNIHLISISTLLFLILLILFNPTNSIRGTSSEIFDNTSDISNIDNNQICPCDMNEGVCDPGCICDKDCLDLMLSNQFFEAYQIEESSYAEENIHSKLDYCDTYIESVDDLYNPLVLAFKILKKGFCLFKGTKDDKEEETEGYDISLNKYESDTNNDNNKEDSDLEDVNRKENNFSEVINFTEFNNFDSLNLFAPIALPNGLCLFHSYQIKLNIDYEVTCSYDKGKKDTIIREFNETNVTNYYITDFYYNNVPPSKKDKYYMKKIEIIFYNHPPNNTNNCLIFHYFEYNNNVNDHFIDLTIEVKFIFNETDFKLSGNPGYIKGQQIIFGNNQTFIKGIVFPLEKIGNEKNVESNSISDTILPSDSTNHPSQKIGSIEADNTIPTSEIPQPTPENNDYIYFDNYMDNKITFEDLIIYGYQNDNYFFNLKGLFIKNKNNLFFAKFGNGKRNETVNIKIEENSNNNNNIVILGKYKDSGSVNNTQFQIHNLDVYKNDQSEAHKSYHYFIIKLVKLETKTEWFHAPGPVIVNLPRNIMYPFKIGTSKYKR